ncbi:hypothetical protein BD413DRAFT_607782 [Trametes elegans]|nr:hypothetical protein BD413DRAFT_607782 [Trametes elegans]
MGMEKLATELLLEIFALACTDGGPTACALSLVSHHIRRASYPVRFHSVSLSGSPRRVQQLLARIHDERAIAGAAAAPKVRHLCLLTDGMAARMDELEPEPEPELGPNEAARGAEEEPLTLLPPGDPAAFSGTLGSGSPGAGPRAGAAPDAQAHARYLRLIAALLSAVAPHVESLTFLKSRHDAPVACAFPRLRVLAVWERNTRPFFAPDAGAPPVHTSGKEAAESAGAPGEGAGALCPRLTRLHLITATPPASQSVTAGLDVARWARHAPELTHLRVSDLTGTPYLRSLEAVYANPREGTTLPPARPFPRMRTVIVQPDPPPATGWCGMKLLEYTRFLDVLWKSPVRARVPVYILPAAAKDRTDVEKRCMRQAREDWEAWLDGELGCWTTPERYARRSQEDEELPAYLTPWRKNVSLKRGD